MRKTQTKYLSNTIQHRQSGRMLPTLLAQASRMELAELPKGWIFDWEKEASKYQVFKLMTNENLAVIEGLISLELRNGFCYVSLVESAPHNRGDLKLHDGVGGNLFAFACKLSIEKGFDGFVVFETKTGLKAYYQESFGAKPVGNSNRMQLDETAAKHLVKIYFK